jgi:predicted GTPase
MFSLHACALCDRSKGRSVDQVVAAVLAAGEQHRRRVSTATLNLVLREAVAWKAPPSQRGNLKQGRIYYATQAAVSPPTFVLFVNDPRLFPDDYRRWVELVHGCACALVDALLLSCHGAQMTGIAGKRVSV